MRGNARENYSSDRDFYTKGGVNEHEGGLQIKFGTDGWRGVIARDFTFDNLSLVAQATMDYLHHEGLAGKGLVVGYDRRFLSREFAERVVEIAAGNGIKSWLADGYAPTPAVSWAVRQLGAGAGVMITASHNLVQRFQGEGGVYAGPSRHHPC
jgi:phosphomannomutase